VFQGEGKAHPRIFSGFYGECLRYLLKLVISIMDPSVALPMILLGLIRSVGNVKDTKLATLHYVTLVVLILIAGTSNVNRSDIVT
jgi:hypothetical protein